MIIIPTETANYIMGRAHSAFVSTRSVAGMEDASICDGEATFTLTKTFTLTLEYCTQCKLKVVEIQTAQGATIMSTTYAPVLKSAEARQLLALAAAYGAKVVKPEADNKQAYLYGDMGDDVVYTRPPDW